MKPRTVVMRVALSGLVAAFALSARGEFKAQRLNNLVTELAKVQDFTLRTPETVEFQNPREGWVFISFDVTLAESGALDLRVGGQGGWDARIQATAAEQRHVELMRWAPGGKTAIGINGVGINGLHNFVVRTMPETQFIRYPQEPHFKELGVFDWPWLKAHALSAVNTLAANPGPESNIAIDEWTALGRRCIAYGGVPQGEDITGEGVFETWHKNPGFQDPRLGGMIADEFSGRQYKPYPAWIEGMRRLGAAQASSPQRFYAYCGGPGMYSRPESRALVQAVFDGGFYMAWERYLHEMPTQEEGDAFIAQGLGKELAKWQKAFPECQRRMVLVLGEFATGPDLDIEPGVNYKVWIDQQMRYLATQPAFDGLFGVQWWYSGGANEELLRWQNALYRHYCIDGATDLLSARFGWNYLSGRAKNPDFHEGFEGWTATPAAADSMRPAYLERYALVQNRYWQRGIEPDDPYGNAYLWMKRVDGNANVVSQTIQGLSLGKVYTAQMIAADYQDIVHGRSEKKELGATLAIDGGEVIKEGSFQRIPQSSPWSHAQLPFKNGPAWFNHYRVMFRATAPSATLSISDDGAAGQELMINYVQVQPYFEESDSAVLAPPL